MHHAPETLRTTDVVLPSRTMLTYCWTCNMQAEGRHTAGRATAQSPEKRGLNLCELQMWCVSPCRNMLNYCWTCTLKLCGRQLSCPSRPRTTLNYCCTCNMQAEGRHTAGRATAQSHTSYVSCIKKDPGPLELFRQTAPGGEPPNHFMGGGSPPPRMARVNLPK